MKKIVAVISCVLVLGIVVVGALVLLKIPKPVEEVYTVDAAALAEEIRDIGELATAEYRYTNVGSLDATKKLFETGISIPGTKKTVVVTMDGIIKVGVDVNEIDISCNEVTKTITITLPKPKMLSHELDEDSLRVYDESAGIFNQITLEDTGAIRSQIKETAEENAAGNGVYEQATENAQNIISCMLGAIPELADTYTIQYR